MTLCGKCLHNVLCHNEINGHLMLCLACQKLCDKEQFSIRYKHSSIETIMRIGANRQ